MQQQHQTSEECFDFVIIGSGFGGSVSAMRLAEKGYRVLVLERGKRYSSDTFPKTNLNIFKYLWLPALRCFGFQGLDFFKDIWVLTGSGVGGGSLVYAGTLLRPTEGLYKTEGFRDLADWESELSPHFDTAERMLGVAENPRFFPADQILYDIATELEQEDTFQPTPLSIYFGEPGETVPDPYFDGLGPDRTGCVFCGGCMAGCRYDAKNSLDKNYLYLAEKLGTEVRPEANVLQLSPLYGKQPENARYEILYERTTDWFYKRRRRVRARNVVLSAGVFGTINLLLKSRDETSTMPMLSSQIGENARSNSEALMGVTAYDDDVDYSEGVAISSQFWVDEVTSVEPCRYSPGSSFMRNLAMPLADPKKTNLERIWSVIATTAKRPKDFLNLRISRGWAEKNTVMLIMQNVENRMRFKRGRDIWTFFRRRLVSEQDQKRPIPAVLEVGHKVTRSFAQKAKGSPWSSMSEVLLGTPATAHIMGGCSIGKDDNSGVVDANHELFNYPGAYVVDASVVPANLGVNPSLTITAMAERAMSHIPEASEVEDYLQLEKPPGLVEKGEQWRGVTVAGKLVLPFLVLALSLIVGKWLFGKR
jgi:cholesterol oxidase